jgi:hypothetical protein
VCTTPSTEERGARSRPAGSGRPATGIGVSVLGISGHRGRLPPEGEPVRAHTPSLVPPSHPPGSVASVITGARDNRAAGQVSREAAPAGRSPHSGCGPSGRTARHPGGIRAPTPLSTALATPGQHPCRTTVTVSGVRWISEEAELFDVVFSENRCSGSTVTSTQKSPGRDSPVTSKNCPHRVQL